MNATAAGGTPNPSNKLEKKVRKILPKNIASTPAPSSASVETVEKSKNATPPLPLAAEMQIAISPPATVKNANNGQYMIPVTLLTPCKNCKKIISASNVQDIQHHVCAAKFKNVHCTVENCDKKFFTQLTLRYHLKHYHRLGRNKEVVAKKSKPNECKNNDDNNDPSKKFICPFANCGKRYRTKGYLEEHKRSAHTGERPFVCDNCTKGFTRILDLKKHQLLKVCHLNSK